MNVVMTAVGSLGAMLRVATVAMQDPMDKYVALCRSLHWIAEASVMFDLKFLDPLLAPLVDVLGDACLVKYTLSMFLVFPLGFVLRSLPGSAGGGLWLKHAFSMLGGVAITQWVFRAAWVHTFVSSTGTYLICCLAPRKSAGDVAFVWMMVYMTVSHMYRMYVAFDIPEMDFTMMQMVLTMKMTGFAYNYSDGSKAAQATIAAAIRPASKNRPAVVNYNAQCDKYSLVQLPSPLAFFGYTYCFTCILAGPAFEYADYYCGLAGTPVRKVCADATGSDDRAKKLPSPTGYAWWLLLQSLVALGINQGIAMHLPLQNLSNTAVLSLHPLHINYGRALITLIGERCKYFFAWKVAEAACVAAGFGFEGYGADGASLGYAGVSNVDIVNFELATSAQRISRTWNMRTQGWLERYCFNRLAKRSLLKLYLVSALWHGLYPGYFFFFVSVAIMTSCERIVSQALTPLMCVDYDPKSEPMGSSLNTMPPTGNRYYWLLSWLVTHATFNAVVQPFSNRTWVKSVTTQAQFWLLPQAGYIAAALVLAPLLVAVFGKPVSASSRTKKRD